MTREWVLRVILQGQQTVCDKDQPLQHLHVHHKLEDHHGLPQLTIKTKISRIHWNGMESPMDPPEHVQNLVKERARCQNLTLEHHQAQVLLHNLLDHLRTQQYVQHVAKVAIGAKISLTTIFVVCRVTTHSTHMCRVSKHGNTTAGSPVCIYCGKTNHGLAYCRYRPKDNREEPGNTPDVLRNGTIGKNLALAARNQTGSAPHNNNNIPSLIQMVEDKINPIEVNRDPNVGISIMEVNTDLNIESKLVLLPEANIQILILFFLLGDSNTLILMKVSTGDILPPHFLPLDLITQWPVMLLVGPSFN